MTPDFTRFAAIDWSGAKGARHKGIAVALCDTGQEAPRLVSAPGGVWSRTDVADWLISTALLFWECRETSTQYPKAGGLNVDSANPVKVRPLTDCFGQLQSNPHQCREVKTPRAAIQAVS